MTQDSTAEVAALYSEAVSLHQAGQFTAAAARYREVLKRQPSHFDALHMTAITEFLAGRQEESLPWIDQALQIKPLDPVALYHRGAILLRLNRAEEALACFDRALAIKPDYVEAHGDRGIALRDLKRHEESMASYHRALALKPDYAEALNNLGAAFLQQGNLAEAATCFRGVAARRPDFPGAWNNLGIALVRQGNFNEAKAYFEKAIALDPRLADAHYHLATIHLNQGSVQDAAAGLRTALALKPDFAEVLNNLGIVSSRQAHLDEAIAYYRQALVLRPRFAEAHNNLGMAYLDQGKPEQALPCFQTAVAVTPDVTVANQFSGVDPHWNEALCRLLMGDYRQGWEKFEWRRKLPEFIARHSPRPASPWRGQEDITGKRLLLWAEQGLGDTLQFCRYAEAVAARGAAVVLQVQPPLKLLLNRLQGVARVISEDEAPPEFDYHCPLLSLPLAFGTTLDTIPAAIPYLSADPAKSARWQARLGSAGGLRRVGLAWSGNVQHKGDRRRSIPLAELRVLAHPAVHFVGLQHEVRDADRPAMACFPSLENCGEALADFDDTAALIACLDLVITVDTAVAHLAGALGKPVWILLPHAPDWRWLLNRNDSPWYPTARLYRQASIGDWTTVLQEVAAALDVLPRH